MAFNKKYTLNCNKKKDQIKKILDENTEEMELTSLKRIFKKSWNEGLGNNNNKYAHFLYTRQFILFPYKPKTDFIGEVKENSFKLLITRNSNLNKRKLFNLEGKYSDYYIDFSVKPSVVCKPYISFNLLLYLITFVGLVYVLDIDLQNSIWSIIVSLSPIILLFAIILISWAFTLYSFYKATISEAKRTLSELFGGEVHEKSKR